MFFLRVNCQAPNRIKNRYISIRKSISEQSNLRPFPFTSSKGMSNDECEMCNWGMWNENATHNSACSIHRKLREADPTPHTPAINYHHIWPWINLDYNGSLTTPPTAVPLLQMGTLRTIIKQCWILHLFHFFFCLCVCGSPHSVNIAVLVIRCCDDTTLQSNQWNMLEYRTTCGMQSKKLAAMTGCAADWYEFRHTYIGKNL